MRFEIDADDHVKNVAERIDDETLAWSFVEENHSDPKRVKYLCTICGKTYVHEKGAMTHMLAHLDEQNPIISTRWHEILKRDLEGQMSADMTNFLEHLDKVDRMRSEYKKIKKDFARRILENPIHALRWHTKNLVMYRAKSHMAYELYSIKEATVAEEGGWHDGTMWTLMERFLEWYDGKTTSIVTSPPIHSSTCPMTNIMSQFDNEARCSMVSSLSSIWMMMLEAKRCLAISKYHRPNKQILKKEAP